VTYVAKAEVQRGEDAAARGTGRDTIKEMRTSWSGLVVLASGGRRSRGASPRPCGQVNPPGRAGPTAGVGKRSSAAEAAAAGLRRWLGPRATKMAERDDPAPAAARSRETRLWLA
jgi:hypothetical protein